jgi:hypothetical protein
MLADLLHLQQPSIAKMERRTHMCLSTLRNHIEAMGGQLEVAARFPAGAVKISHFSRLEQPSVVWAAEFNFQGLGCFKSNGSRRPIAALRQTPKKYNDFS